MIRAKFTETGEVDFQDLIKRLKNPRPLLSEVGDIIKDDVTKRISKTKVSPNGQKWAPWADSTYISRIKDGTAHLGLLNHTGTLLNSIQKTVKSRQVVIDSTAPYAGFLQSGTKNMPARPFIGISQQAEKDISALVHDYLGLK